MRRPSRSHFEVEPEGVEPSSPVCKTSILPLNDSPSCTVNPPGVEPGPSVLQTDAQTTTPEAHSAPHRVRGRVLDGTARRARSDLADCQRPSQGAARPSRRRSLDARWLPAVDSNHAVSGSKPGALPLGELASVAVGPEGLEPSPLRVKAAFSASRDPGPRFAPLPRTAFGAVWARSAPHSIFSFCTFNFKICFLHLILLFSRMFRV